jgi:hypothetical protein
MATVPEPCPDRHAGCARNVAALQEAQQQIDELEKKLAAALAKSPTRDRAVRRTGGR